MRNLSIAILLLASPASAQILNQSGVNIDGVSGTLQVENGGTENTTLTDNAVLVGDGTNAVHASTSVNVMAGGNVGVGTTGPLKKLEVNGTFQADGAATFADAVTVSTSITIPAGSMAVTPFSVGGSSLVLLGTGNTGVGTSGPTKLLEVNGTLQANGAATFNTSVTISSAAAGTVLSVVSGGVVVSSITAIGLFPPVNGPEDIAAAATITANACGGLKRLSTGGAVTTNTTDTFTAPAAANRGCCMKLFLDPGAGGNLVLDANAKFNTLAGTDVTMTTCDMVEVCSDGVDWTQASPIQVNTCN